MNIIISNEVNGMQVALSSGNYKIVDSGQVFLYKDEDLRMTVNTGCDYIFTLVFKFIQVDLLDSRIDKKVIGNEMEIQCINFDRLGMGLMEPMNIAKIGGKELLLMFWSNIEGSNEDAQVRSLKYTIYMEM